MSKFNEILVPIKNQLRQIWGYIQASPIYLKIYSWYHDQPPRTQKSLLYVSVLFIILFFISFPYGYFSESNEYISSFEDNKILLEKLQFVGHEMSGTSSAQLPPEPVDFQSIVNGAITGLGLTPDQFSPPQVVTPEVGNIGSSNLEPKGVQVLLKKLNLKQITDASYKLKSLNPQYHLFNMELAAIKDNNHYYDAKFELVAFFAKAKFSQEKPTNKKVKKEK